MSADNNIVYIKTSLYSTEMQRVRWAAQEAGWAYLEGSGSEFLASGFLASMAFGAEPRYLCSVEIQRDGDKYALKFGDLPEEKRKQSTTMSEKSRAIFLERVGR